MTSGVPLRSTVRDESWWQALPTAVPSVISPWSGIGLEGATSKPGFPGVLGPSIRDPDTLLYYPERGRRASGIQLLISSKAIASSSDVTGLFNSMLGLSSSISGPYSSRVKPVMKMIGTG